MLFRPCSSAAHAIALCASLCVAFYMYYLFSEQRRLDAKVTAITGQLVASQRATQAQVDALAKAFAAAATADAPPGGGGTTTTLASLSSLLPMLFSSSDATGAPFRVHFDQDEEEDEEYEDDDAEDDEGDGGADDDERIRRMLVASMDEGACSVTIVEEDDDDDLVIVEAASAVIPEPEPVVETAGRPEPVVEETACSPEPSVVETAGSPEPVVVTAAVEPVAEEEVSSKHTHATEPDVLSNLKVDDLRQRLRDLGIDTKGPKAALIERLESAAANYSRRN